MVAEVKVDANGDGVSRLLGRLGRRSGLVRATTPERRCLRRAAILAGARGAPVGVRGADDVRAFVAVFVAAAMIADVAGCIQTKMAVSGAYKRKWMKQVRTSSNTSARRRSPVSLSIQ